MFEWLTAVPHVAWSTTVALVVIAAVAVWLSKLQRNARLKGEIREAEKAYRLAVASGDVDYIHITAKRLRALRAQVRG